MGHKGIHGLDLRNLSGEVDPNHNLASLVGEGKPDAALVFPGHGRPLPYQFRCVAPRASGQQSMERFQGGLHFRMKGPIGFES
jgi:hypothetical protein